MNCNINNNNVNDNSNCNIINNNNNDITNYKCKIIGI